MAEALARVDQPVSHVFHELGPGTATVYGQTNIEDVEIARWCGQTGTVLVTIDEDFRARWVRSGALERHGVEVICFDRDIIGLQEQHRRVTVHLPAWQQELTAHPYAHRVWLQTTRQRPEIIVGKRKARKAPRPVPVPHGRPRRR